MTDRELGGNYTLIGTGFCVVPATAIDELCKLNQGAEPDRSNAPMSHAPALLPATIVFISVVWSVRAMS